MSTFRSVLSLLSVCVVVVLLCVLGLASDFATHLLTNIDGLLLLMICLLMGGLFALMLLVLAKESGLLSTKHSSPFAAAGTAKSLEGKS